MDPYQVLSISRADAAHPHLVKAAHKRARQRWHPDRPGGDHERFLEVDRAAAILANPRHELDELVERWRSWTHGAYAREARRHRPPEAPKDGSEWVWVEDVRYFTHSKHGRPDSIAVVYETDVGTVRQFLCPRHGGYAQRKFVAMMHGLGQRYEPRWDAGEYVARTCRDWPVPDWLRVRQNGRWWDVLEADYPEEG